MTYLRGLGPRFVTVCDRGGLKFIKSSTRYEQLLISKDYNYTNINVQQILVVTFELTGAARSFMIMSCAARRVQKVGQHWPTVSTVFKSRNGFVSRIVRETVPGRLTVKKL